MTLSHAEKDDLLPDTAICKGSNESLDVEQFNKIASRGYLRNNLIVLNGGMNAANRD